MPNFSFAEKQLVRSVASAQPVTTHALCGTGIEPCTGEQWWRICLRGRGRETVPWLSVPACGLARILVAEPPVK
jgi:hypothetical protein